MFIVASTATAPPSRSPRRGRHRDRRAVVPALAPPSDTSRTGRACPPADVLRLRDRLGLPPLRPSWISATAPRESLLLNLVPSRILELLSRAVVATGERGRSVPRGSPRAGGQSDPTDRPFLLPRLLQSAAM